MKKLAVANTEEILKLLYVGAIGKFSTQTAELVSVKFQHLKLVCLFINVKMMHSEKQVDLMDESNAEFTTRLNDF